MNASELQLITDFVQGLVPFDSLSNSTLDRCCKSLRVGHYSQTSTFVPFDEVDPLLYIVRSGAFEVRSHDGELLDRLGEGDYFGFPSLLSGEKVSNRIRILADAVVYHLDSDTFDYLRAESRQFDRYFNRAFAKRLRDQAKFSAKELTTSSRVSALMSHSPLMVDINTRVSDVAKKMCGASVSSVLVLDNGQLCGVLTDSDMRNRILAAGKDGSCSVQQAMTPEPHTLDSNALVFEAMLLMNEHSIEHLPIVDDNKVVGILTKRDICKGRSTQPLLLIGEIERQSNVDSLVSVSQQIPLLLQNLINTEARAEEIGRVLSAVSDALTRRLIILSQQWLGDAPMAFCWLAFGSQGRQDQTACSDQNNGLLLANEPSKSESAYFDALTKAVCGGLDKCSYFYCPGNIMAQNPQWRLSLSQWRQQFTHWVDASEPKALMNASIFFDMRSVFGSCSLFDSLQDRVLANTYHNNMFLASMTHNTLMISPPLGFLNKFVFERDGYAVKGIDLKHKGNALINDIVRIYALSAGIKEVNTARRIFALMEQGIVNRKDGLNLADAHEFIAHMRLSNQRAQYIDAKPISNYLKPKHQSSLLRQQLRDAFKVIIDAQSGIKLKFSRSV